MSTSGGDRDANSALISLKDMSTFRCTLPFKLQASLSHGTTAISTVQGDVRASVEEFSVGFTADAEDVDSLESAFRRATALGGRERKNMTQSARSAYLSEFSLDAGVAAVEDILQIASRSRGRRGSETHSKGDVYATG